jgi:aminoglycoside phosphotransferase (APT) family kinase protein
MTANSALSDRVHTRLAGLFPGTAIGELTELRGGHSGLTYRVTVGETAVVIKAVPAGRPAIGRHDMLRQARILGALTGSGVPVPALITSDDVEPAWYAMSWANGEAVEPVLDGITLAPGLASERALIAARLLAELHRVQPAELAAVEAVPLRDEVAKWSAVLHAGPAEFIPAGAELCSLLADRIPSPIAPTIVHGDYRLGNILFDGSAVQAIVDWEIWGIGDRRVDVGYFAVFADHRNFPELGTEVADLPSELELIQAYADAFSQPVAEAAWFQALGRFKMASIMAHNLRRHREGRHNDPAQETLPPTIRALTETGRELLSGAPADR